MSRKNKWNEIWNKKYTAYLDAEHLHVSAGYDDLSYPEWKKLTSFFIDKLNFKATDDVLEIGCGSGAFLKELPTVNTISGVDYAEDAITKINSIFDGDFQVAEAVKLPYPDNSFSKVISFGVFFYFDDYTYASQDISEMKRILKPDGIIFIGEVNNIEKKELALKLRNESEEQRNQHRVSSNDVDHLYYPKYFFKEIALKNNFKIEIIDQNISELDFYYNASYRFSVILTSTGVE